MLNQIKVGTKMVCVTKSVCSELKKFQVFGDFDDTKANNNQNKIVICLESDILMPADMVFCSYVHSPSYSATSTNGMSAGGNLNEFIIIGVLRVN